MEALGTRFEAKDTVDYLYVIHRQLDRVAWARSRLLDAYNSESEGYYPFGLRDMVMGRGAIYLNTVVTLYALLPPELKNPVKEYVMRAMKIRSICKYIWQLKDDVKELRDDTKYSEKKEKKEEASKKLREIEKIIEEKYEEISRLLPPDYAEIIDTATFLGEKVAVAADMVLEKVLEQLARNGLLIRGASVKVGVSGALRHDTG